MSKKTVEEYKTEIKELKKLLKEKERRIEAQGKEIKSHCDYALNKLEQCEALCERIKALESQSPGGSPFNRQRLIKRLRRVPWKSLER